MIICYHKNRRRFYVVASNKSHERKTLFSSDTFNDCDSFCNGKYDLANSAKIALSGGGRPPHRGSPRPGRPTHPPTDPTTLSDASSDRLDVEPLSNLSPAPPAPRDDEAIRILAMLICSIVGDSSDPWVNYINDARQVMYDIKALKRKRV